jgi:hypothetical protein
MSQKKVIEAQIGDVTMLITFNTGVFRMMCISGDVRILGQIEAPVSPLLIMRVTEVGKVDLSRSKKIVRSFSGGKRC